MDSFKMLNEFLSPASLREKLIQASVFIAVYENFKSSIVDNVKYFYCMSYLRSHLLYSLRAIFTTRTDANKNISAFNR